MYTSFGESAPHIGEFIKKLQSLTFCVIFTLCFWSRCFILLLFIYMQAVVDQLPRLGKRELICLLSFTCYYVVSVRRGFLFLWVLGIGYVI